MRSTRPVVLPAALLLLAGLSACGAQPAADDSAAETPSDSGGVASACLEGAEDCDDIPTGTGGPESGPDASLPVADAVSAGVDGPFVMSGFLVDDGSQTRLCQALAESLPPQCGGTFITLDETSSELELDLMTEGEVSWSSEPVSVEGQIDGDVFVVGSP